ncbi:hypothetical protein RUND412_002851 [Rhizina undulata]
MMNFQTSAIPQIEDRTLAFSLPGIAPDAIIYTPTKDYILHSQVLRLCSAWFAENLVEAMCAPCLNDTFSDDYKYRFSLTLQKDGLSSLTPSQDVSSLPTDPPPPETDIQALENLLKSFYHQSLTVHSTDTLFALAGTAEKYSALQVVAAPIFESLFSLTTIETQILQNPVQFLLLGYKLKSAELFEEAFIHVAGQWRNPGFSETHQDLPEPVLELVEAESLRLERMVAEAMRKLHGIKYQTCRLSKRIVLEKVNEVFRRFGQPGREGVLFAKLAGCTFELSKEDEEEHAKWRRGNRCTLGGIDVSLEECLVQAASGVRVIAAELTKNNTRLGEQQRYLTCGELPDGEFPWFD